MEIRHCLLREAGLAGKRLTAAADNLEKTEVMILGKIFLFLLHRLKRGDKRCNIKIKDSVEMEGRL